MLELEKESGRLQYDERVGISELGANTVITSAGHRLVSAGLSLQFFTSPLSHTRTLPFYKRIGL
jgi:hypothetical protein